MSFPESVDTVTLTCGPVLDADGNPRAGVKLYAIPARHVFIAATKLRPGILSASTGADGRASLEVIATDSAGLADITGATVTSFRYRIGLDDISTASSEREVYLPKAHPTTAYEDLVANTSATTPTGLSSTFATRTRDLFLATANAAAARSSLDLGVMGTPPTIATDVASLDAGLTKTYSVATTPSSFRTCGGTPTVFSTNFWTFPVVHVNAGSGNLGGTASAAGHAVEFMADADVVQIMLLRGSSSLGAMIEVDGQKVQADSIDWTETGSTMYVLLTFASRAVRRFRAESDQYAGFRGVNVGPTCTVWAPPSPDITVAVVGDSITAQTGVTLPNGGWAHGVGKLLGWPDVREVALSGSGYVTAGGSSCTFGDPTRVSDVVACSPDLVIIPGSTNDNTASASALSAAALAAWQAYRVALPSTPVVVGGIFPGAGGPSATVLTNEAALKTAFDTWADPNSYWVPISTDTSGAWVSGTGKVGTTNSSGNSDIYVGADGVHPTQAGHDYYARRWAAALKERVLPHL